MNRRWWFVAGATVLVMLAAALAWQGLRGDDTDPEPAAQDAPGASATASPSPLPSSVASPSASPSLSATPPRSSKPGHPPPPKPPGQHWKVAPGQPWQWQLTTPVDLSVNVPIYDIDGFDNSAEVVRKLHAAGRKVICYVEVGSAADFRP